MPGPCHLIKMRNSLPEMSISANDRGRTGEGETSEGEGRARRFASRSYKLK